MSSGSVQNKQDTCNVPQKNIIVSIILSESTTSLLDLNIPNLDDLLSESNESSIFSLKTASKIEENISPKQNIQSFFFRNKENKVSKQDEQIQIEMAYFSNTYKDSNTSVEDHEDEQTNADMYEVEEQTTDQTRILESSTIYTRPLLSARTTAHQNKIRCESNNICISILKSELTITSSGWVNFCRICHGGESVANLISPCRCKGSIALTHLQCLEEWLKRSANSRCELCQHHYEIVRQPKYSIPWSILVFLLKPGDHFRELLLDVFGFLIYTPTAIASTYMLMVLCDAIATKTNLNHTRNISAHFMAFSAVFGMATIDFTYSSWLVVMLQRHMDAWKQWYQNSCTLRVILPERKQRRHSRRRNKTTSVNTE